MLWKRSDEVRRQERAALSFGGYAPKPQELPSEREVQSEGHSAPNRKGLVKMRKNKSNPNPKNSAHGQSRADPPHPIIPAAITEPYAAESAPGHWLRPKIILQPAATLAHADRFQSST